jgi:hypothetical protein
MAKMPGSININKNISTIVTIKIKGLTIFRVKLKLLNIILWLLRKLFKGTQVNIEFVNCKIHGNVYMREGDMIMGEGTTKLYGEIK